MALRLKKESENLSCYSCCFVYFAFICQTNRVERIQHAERTRNETRKLSVKTWPLWLIILFQNLSMSRSNILRSMKGTPHWMAPEVIRETGHGRKSDIWWVSISTKTSQEGDGGGLNVISGIIFWASCVDLGFHGSGVRVQHLVCELSIRVRDFGMWFNIDPSIRLF